MRFIGVIGCASARLLEAASNPEITASIRALDPKIPDCKPLSCNQLAEAIRRGNPTHRRTNLKHRTQHNLHAPLHFPRIRLD